MLNIISIIIFYMPHDFILQHIRISITTLSKYIRVKKHKKTHVCTGWYLHPVQMSPIPRVGGREAPVTNVGYLYRVSRPV
jgi:hypothetical protein